MIVFKRRLIFWLIKAYLKRWGKILGISFVVGLVIFFVLMKSFPYILAAFTGVSKETIGVVGSYTLDNLPPEIVTEVSRGLTKVSDNGSISPDVASSWEIKNNGKVYIFHLRKGLFFDDGTPLTSKDIKTSFADVTVMRPNDTTIVYELKESYAPFLITVSRPIFKDNLVGMGPYRIKQAKVNGTYLENLTLASFTQAPALKIYQFYPTQDALKVGFVMGEITKALNVTDVSFRNTNFSTFPHVKLTQTRNYDQLVTLFYNTQDKDLSDSKLREALGYAIPNSFAEGQRAYSPIPPISWAYNPDVERSQDLTHAKLLLEASLGTDTSKYPTIVISTFSRFEKTAEEVQREWKKIGVKSTIQVVSSLPPVFQVYLGSFNVPKDPDQYTLWHSYQSNNISNYNKNKRIDKLLEDGRQTIDKDQRLQMYLDFQKYLIADQPASFLYFPMSYTLERN